MKSRFFLPGIAPDVTRIAHAFEVRFLYPLIHFILILKEPVAAKDIPPRKRQPNGGYAPCRIPAFPVVRRLERFNKISKADFQ
jgi:hypothetical protein